MTKYIIVCSMYKCAGLEVGHTNNFLNAKGRKMKLIAVERRDCELSINHFVFEK